jgi:hypothetical protein
MECKENPHDGGSTAVRRLKEPEGRLDEKKVAVLKPFTLDELLEAIGHAFHDSDAAQRGATGTAPGPPPGSGAGA